MATPMAIPLTPLLMGYPPGHQGWLYGVLRAPKGGILGCAHRDEVLRSSESERDPCQELQNEVPRWTPYHGMATATNTMMAYPPATLTPPGGVYGCWHPLALIPSGEVPKGASWRAHMGSSDGPGVVRSRGYPQIEGLQAPSTSRAKPYIHARARVRDGIPLHGSPPEGPYPYYPCMGVIPPWG